MTDREWLEARRRGLGASDAPAVCGLSPWKTPLHVYLDKTGELADLDSNPKLWGRRLEDIVAQAYSEETGNPVYAPARRLEAHPQLPWLLCSLDRLTEVGGRGRVLECKTVRSDSDEWGAPGTDEVPGYYLVQCQHQLAVTGFEACDLAALFGGQELRTYTIERDEAVLSRLRLILSDFWARVQARRPPEPTWSHSETPALVRQLQRGLPGLAIELGEEHAEAARRDRELGRQLAVLEKEREVIRARLTWVMGEAETARLPGGWRIHRRRVQRKAYEVPGGEYWTFRVLKAKD
jgi:putative phage-type endonuclease